MSVSQLSDEDNRVHTGVLSESVGDEFKSFTVSTGDIRVRSEDFSAVLLELVGNFHLDAGSTLDGRSLLNESADNTEGVMERAVSFG